jgi:hypothetical protein
MAHQDEAERRRLELEATRLLRLAGLRPDGAPLGSRNGSRVLARASYNGITPTDARGSDHRLKVVTSPGPALPPDTTRPRFLGTIRGPNGRPWSVWSGSPDPVEPIKVWSYIPIRQGQTWSRAQEWTFEGPADEVNATERFVMLTSAYFEMWIRQERHRAADSTIEREVRIAISYLAECSPWLTFRGRNGSLDTKARLTRPEHQPSARPALSATAAACRVSVATVRRIVRELEAFNRSPLFQEKAARYDRLPDPTLL